VESAGIVFIVGVVMVGSVGIIGFGGVMVIFAGVVVVYGGVLVGSVRAMMASGGVLMLGSFVGAGGRGNGDRIGKNAIFKNCSDLVGCTGVGWGNKFGGGWCNGCGEVLVSACGGGVVVGWCVGRDVGIGFRRSDFCRRSGVFGYRWS